MTSSTKVQSSKFGKSSVINSEAPSEAESGYTSNTTTTYKDGGEEAINMMKPKIEDILKPKQEEGLSMGNQNSCSEEHSKENPIGEETKIQAVTETEEKVDTTNTSNDKEEATDNDRLMEVGGGDSICEDLSLRYKFKSKIQHRFRQTSMQDEEIEFGKLAKRLRHDTDESFVETSKPNDCSSPNFLEIDSLQSIYKRHKSSEDRSQAGHGLSQFNLGMSKFDPPRGKIAVIQETLSHSNNEQESSEKAQGFPHITISEPKEKANLLYHPRNPSDTSPFSKIPTMLLEPEVKPSISPNPYISRSPLCISPIPKPSGHSVPIFALHSKGSYYIPLSVDMSAISSYVSLFTGLEDTTTPLHPITISVNFNREAPATAPGNLERSGIVEPTIPRLWSGTPVSMDETKDWSRTRLTERRDWEGRNIGDIADWERTRERENRDWESDRKPRLEDEKQPGGSNIQQQGVIRQHWKAKKLWNYPGTGY